MLESEEDTVKRRLVDRVQIAAVVDYMRGHGLDTEVIAVELARMFYVDMDELNSVLSTVDVAPVAVMSATGMRSTAPL